MDSKAIKEEAAREEVFARLVATPGVRYALAKAEAPAIDENNILQANLACMRACAETLRERLGGRLSSPDDVVTEVVDVGVDESEDAGGDESEFPFLAVVDGVDDPWRMRPARRRENSIAVLTVTKGDASVPAISAASIIAKVTRDRLMRGLADEYPEYGWAENKAYGSASHRAAIARHGWVPGVHRESFDPVRTTLEKGGTNKRLRAAKKPAAAAAKKPRRR